MPDHTYAHKCRFYMLEGLFFLISVLRFAYPFAFNPLDHLHSDWARHWHNAQSLSLPSFSRGLDPAGYQFYLHTVRWLTQDSRPGIALFAGLLCAALPWLWMRITRELGLSHTSALLCGIIVGLMPSLWLTYAFFATETLLLDVMAAAILLSLLYVRRGGAARFFAQGVAWASAAICKLSALPVMLAFVFYSFMTRPPRWPAAALSLGAAMGIIALAGWHNAVSTGYFAPFGTPQLPAFYARSGAARIHIEFDGRHYWFQSPSLLHRHPMPWLDWQSPRVGDAAIDVHSATARQDWEKGLARFPVTADSYLRQIQENIAYGLFDASWPENMLPPPLRRLNAASRFLWFPLLLAVTAGAMATWRRQSAARRVFLLATLLMAAALLLQFTGVMEARYRKPLEPMLILAGFLAWEAARRDRENTPPAG